MSHNLDEIAARLRQQGYRVTPQRQLIIDAVCALGGHVTPEAVHAHVSAITPALSPSTVYRTLHFLHEQGILTSAQLPDSRLGYELAGKQAHHHLLCRQCGAVQHLNDNHFQPIFDHLREEHAFEPELNHLTIRGLCAGCQS